MGYGDRYMRVWEFVKYCKKLNVETDEAELEYYESQGLMLPTARVVLPEDYVRLTSSTGGEYAQHDVEQAWPVIFRLYDRPLIVEADYASLTNEELLASFDREFGHNPYLLKPSVGGFRPWNTYDVVVDEENEVRPSQAEHYYSYWQAHQLYAIQKFPDLYKNRHLIAELPARLRKKWHRPWAFDVEYYRTFRDQAASFDALSFFILMSYREKRRTFAALPAAYSIKRLNQQQHQDYIKRLSSHARFVAERYGIDEEDIYRFLRFLVDLYRDYRDAERLKLADAVKSDIIYQAHFASELTGKSWEELADELVKNARLGTKHTFLTLDKSATVRRRAGMFLELKVKQHHQELVALSIQNPRYSFTNADITELTQFCEEHDLTILLEIIEGMIAVSLPYRKYELGRR